MTVAAGSFSTIRYKRQSGIGVYSGTGGQILRRLEDVAGVNLNRPKIENNQIRSDRMPAAPRLGLGMTEFPYKDYVTPGTHAPFYESICLGAFATAPTTGAQTNITAAVTAAPAGTFTRASGSYLSDGFLAGQIVSWTGWTTTGTANNSHNFRIVSVTATVMTCEPLDGVALVAKASGDSVTCVVKGKQVKVPTSGHADHYYYFEDWQADIAQSEQMPDARVESIAISISPNAQPTIDIGFKGLGSFPTATSAYFASPTAEASTPVCSVAYAKLCLDGVAVATVTTLNVTITVELDMPATVCTTSYPFAASTIVKPTGSMTVLWEDQALFNKYKNEQDLALVLVLVNDTTATADFVAFTLQRLRLTEAKKAGGKGSKTKNYTFDAIENSAGTAGTQTSVIAIQDSLAP